MIAVQQMQRPWSTVLALLALLACQLQQPAAGQSNAGKPLSGWITGFITHYGGAQDNMDPNSPSFGTVEGACGYGSIPKDQYPYFAVAALSPQNQFYKAGPLNGCGECFEIQCQGPACKLDSSGQPESAVVMISDACPECEADHIDMQSLSFAKLANPAIGNTPMRYRRVECTPPADMKVAVLDFRGAGGWVRLSIDSTGGRGSVKAVSVKSSSAVSWQPLKNSWGAQWELSNSPPAPLDFKIECDDGESVVANGVIKQAGGISSSLSQPIQFNTGVQFTITGQPRVGSDGAPAVAAFDGPPDSSSTGPAPAQESSTNGRPSTSAPAAAPSAGAQPSTATSSCVDLPAPGAFSCQQQKDFGKCSDAFMTQGGFCAATCGRCSPGARPAVQSFSGPSKDGNRRLLKQSSGA